MQRHRAYYPKDEQETHAGDQRWRGVNCRLAPGNLEPGYLSDGVNTRMLNGDVEPRLGVVKPGWLNVTAASVDAGIRPVDTFYGSGVFKDPASVEWVFLAADGRIFRCKENNARFEMPLPAGVKIFSACTFTQAFNKVFCFRGRYLAPLLLSDIDTGFEDIVAHYDAADTYEAAVGTLGRDAEEIAYGPFQAVTSVSSVADMVTVVTPVAHGYVTGADITVQGAAQAEYNGRWNITVVDEFTFKYQFAGSATTPATGTIKASNMGNYWKALGSKVTLASLTSVTTTATATKVAHGFTTGQYVTIAGATGADATKYNGTFLITVTGADTFTYVMAVAPAASPATGTITAQTSITLAGQSPDTNPEAWQRIHNILPNADDALYINNRLLVPTAYTPGADGYDDSSSYTKKDYLVATDVLDEIHFDFINEFRINEGDDSEITCMVKYDNDTVIIFKGRVWGVLSNIRLNLDFVTWDQRGGAYGACAPRSAVAAGKDVFAPVAQRGIISLNQTVNGEIQSVDIPFSNDIEPWVRRINWNLADKIRLAWWDNKLYVAVPMDDGRAEDIRSIIVTGAGTTGVNGTYTRNGTYSGKPVYYSATGGSIVWTDSGSLWTVNTDNPGYGSYEAVQLPTQVVDWLSGGGFFPGIAPAPQLAFGKRAVPGNSAILVYDFRNQAWSGRDTGSEICVVDFFTATYGGRDRLFYTAENGYVNLLEESTAGDQWGTEDGILFFAEIPMTATTRGYKHEEIAPKKFPFCEIALAVWNAMFTLTANTGASRNGRTLIADKEFSRTAYLKPFDRQPWDPSNDNEDFDEPDRGNYNVAITGADFNLGTTGCDLYKFQDIFHRLSSKTLSGQYIQFSLTNNQGRCALKAIGPAAQAGQRRMGAIN